MPFKKYNFKLKPKPLEELETDDKGACTMYAFDQKFYNNIFKYYDKYIWCRKRKTDDYFLLICDPISASLYVKYKCE
jgi:hypothetical protein